MVSVDTSTVSEVAKIDLVGVAEVAELLGVTRQRVDALARTHTLFPEPVATIAAGRVWLREDIEEWASRDGRLLVSAAGRAARGKREASRDR